MHIYTYKHKFPHWISNVLCFPKCQKRNILCALEKLIIVL